MTGLVARLGVEPIHLWLAAAWAAWGCLHSLLIGRRLRVYLVDRRPGLARHWRLVYAAIAAASLVPPVMLRLAAAGPQVVVWPSKWLVLIVNLSLIPVVWSAFRAFGPLNLLGFNALLGRPDPPRPDKPLTSGVLGWVRHPLYASAIVVLWAHDLDTAGLVTSSVLTVYLLIGAALEERRLAREWGPAWQEYRRQVSAFVPVKRLKRELAERGPWGGERRF